jgi:hypothetical protein
LVFQIETQISETLRQMQAAHSQQQQLIQRELLE